MRKPIKFEITAEEFEQNMLALHKAGLNPWHEPLYVVYDRGNVDWVVKNTDLYNYQLFIYNDDKKIKNLDEDWLSAMLVETISHLEDLEIYKNPKYADSDIYLLNKKAAIEEQLKLITKK